MEILRYIEHIDQLDYFIIGLNLLLIVLTRRILLISVSDNSDMSNFTMKVTSFRLLNILIIVSYGYSFIYLSASDQQADFKLITISLVLYVTFLVKHIFNYWVHKKFGREREVNGDKKNIETYNSRLLSLLGGIVVFVISLITIVNVLEFTSLLQAGGVIGILGVFLALTQNSWAPDIISGLILLNNAMIEEGDVIEFNDASSIIGVIYKTKMFHTEILNLTNNHRIMLKNSRLREFTIQNLSKFASAKGLRESLVFKVSYDVSSEQVKKMFRQAEQAIKKDNPGYFTEDEDFEVGLSETADHALEWTVYYYTKEVKSLIKIRQLMKESILTSAIECGISLATPIQYKRFEN